MFSLELSLPPEILRIKEEVIFSWMSVQVLLPLNPLLIDSFRATLADTWAFTLEFLLCRFSNSIHFYDKFDRQAVSLEEKYQMGKVLAQMEERKQNVALDVECLGSLHWRIWCKMCEG